MSIFTRDIVQNVHLTTSDATNSLLSILRSHSLLLSLVQNRKPVNVQLLRMFDSRL